MALLFGTLTAGSFFIPWVPAQISHAFSDWVVTKGAIGDDVIEAQGRLKLLGFYNGDIDGVFGESTYRALRLFQYEFGMDIDGVLGPETKLKLWEATKNYRPGPEEAAARGTGTTNEGAAAGGTTGEEAAGGGTAGEETAPAAPTTRAIPRTNSSLSDNELRMMANAVYGESRGEPYIGQVAVAAVILNRTRSGSFPSSPTGVIFEPGAFTAVADGQIWLEPDPSARKAVQDALNGWDPTNGALYYFNPETATSPWIWTRPQIKQIGRHIFCR
nr:spore cortex-lytic enzyme [Aneurinibacillus tyrosinisolvens]